MLLLAARACFLGRFLTRIGELLYVTSGGEETLRASPESLSLMQPKTHTIALSGASRPSGALSTLRKPRLSPASPADTSSSHSSSFSRLRDRNFIVGGTVDVDNPVDVQWIWAWHAPEVGWLVVLLLLCDHGTLPATVLLCHAECVLDLCAICSRSTERLKSTSTATGA